MDALSVTIQRFVDDQFPGFVECVVADSDGFKHQFIEKAPVVSRANLSLDSVFPQSGRIACLVQEEWIDERGTGAGPYSHRRAMECGIGGWQIEIHRASRADCASLRRSALGRQRSFSKDCTQPEADGQRARFDDQNLDGRSFGNSRTSQRGRIRQLLGKAF